MRNRLTEFLSTIFNHGRGETKTQRVLSYLTWAAIGVTVLGAMFSALGICTGGCTDAEKFRFFGLSFATAGIPFFLLLSLASFGRNSRRRIFPAVYDTLLAGVVGAEWLFLGIQGRIIKHYCPICIAIAAAVSVALALRLVEAFLRHREGAAAQRKSFIGIGKAFAKTMLVISSLYLGLLVALAGISSPVAAGPGEITQNIWLGKADSNLEVLIVSDWFCPYCRQVEPIIESVLPEIGKVARYSFIDDPIHKESYNFIPSNMSLLLNSKPRYLEARKVLLEIAEHIKAPSTNEIAEALKKKGIILSLAEGETLKQLAKSEASFLQRNLITLTPSVVVRNNKTGATKTLVGVDQITKDRLASLVAEMGE